MQQIIRDQDDEVSNSSSKDVEAFDRYLAELSQYGASGQEILVSLSARLPLISSWVARMSTRGPTYKYAGPTYKYTGPIYKYTGPTYKYTGPTYKYTGPTYKYTGPTYVCTGLTLVIPSGADLSAARRQARLAAAEGSKPAKRRRGDRGT